jgi:hypothetical protein
MAEQTINGISAALIQRTVEKLEREHGVCHPAMLVKAARPKRSPLHDLFTWDDADAAERWRIEQARRVIRTIRVIHGNQPEVAPAFVHVTRVTDEGVQDGYMSTVRALAGDTRDGVLRDALAQLNGLRRRYQQLSELQTVWDAIEDVDREREAA